MHAWLLSLLDLLYPEPALEGELREVQKPFCYVCGEPFAGELNEKSMCGNCHGRQWFIGRARAMYRAEGSVREVIHWFKYHQQFYRLRQLSDWLVAGFERFYQREFSLYDALVPVPLYPVRRRERGYNQAEELAAQLSKRIGMPVMKVLCRVKKTRTQANLRRSERLRNQLGAYRLKGGFDVEGKRLLIIDDVFTTGATVNACARVLRQAGAIQVDVLTVARG